MSSYPTQPPPIPPPPPGVSPTGRLVDPAATPAQRQYAVFMHLTLLLAYVFWGISLIAPIIMWQVKRTESNFIDDHGRETVNFHLTLLMYALIGLAFMLTGVGVCIAIPLWSFAAILGIVGMILAATAAGRGEYYRYPACIRFVR
ncbi:MAG: DUF4870 domain-containing protein [Phycisphaerales bacterium]|nr:DUF4870 domain-containing protein [Phycisphaerales bacterium]